MSGTDHTNENDIAQVLMGNYRVVTVTLAPKAYDYIVSSLSRECLYDDIAFGEQLLSKRFLLHGDTVCSITLYNGGTPKQKPYLEFSVYSEVYEGHVIFDSYEEYFDRIPDEVIFTPQDDNSLDVKHMLRVKRGSDG